MADEGMEKSASPQAAGKKLPASPEQDVQAGDRPPTGEEEAEAFLVSHVSQRFSSPYPPPRVLQEYDEVVPGLAEKLIELVESQTKHRLTLEKRQAELEMEVQRARLSAEIEDMRAERREKRLGQWLGFGIGTIAIVAGAITSVMGAPVSGGFIGAGGVIGLVAVFVIGRFWHPTPQVIEEGDSNTSD